jgi:hypothetical protein
LSANGGGQLTSTLTTTATAVYTFALTSPAGQSANPGALVTYTVSVNNNGNISDTFGLSYAGNGAVAAGAIQSIGPVSAFGSANFVVTVSVPITALAGVQSQVWLTGTSQHTSLQASILITAAASTVYGVKLSPDSSAQAGRSGRVITYTLRLTNTGNSTDTFTPSVTDYPVTFVPTTITSLTAGAGTNFLVVITLPTTTTLTVQDLLIRARSETDPAHQSTYVHVYSTIKPYSVFLPLVLRH